ncbi:MAG: hypothetical protein ABI767_07795 [Rhodanobacter sp.]
MRQAGQAGQASVDPNAEPHHFEPLRVVLAIGTLMLGLLLGLR